MEVPLSHLLSLAAPHTLYFCISLPSLAAHCSEATWHAVLAMAAEIREKNLRISFFNSTPQVGLSTKNVYFYLSK